MANILEFIIRAKDEASKQLKGIDISLGGVMETALGFSLANVGGMVAGEFRDMVASAVDLEGTRLVFGRLTDSIEEDAGRMLTSMKEASMGMVTEGQLMASASKLISMGLADNSEEAAKLTNMAVTLGAAMGKGPTLAMEEFALMLANQSIPRLDTFGISAGKVRTRINELMKETEGLTREQAFMAAVTEEGKISLGRVGDISETTTAKMAKISTVVEEAKVALGELLLPVLGNVAGGFLDLRDNMAEAREEGERFKQETFEGAGSQEEFAEAMYDTLPPLIKQEILMSESKKAVFDLAYAKEYLILQGEKLQKVVSPLVESFTDLDHEMAGAYETEQLFAERTKVLTGSLKELYESQIQISEAPSPWIWFADLEEAAKNMETAIQYTTDARIIGAEQALAAERGAYDQSLVAAQETAEGVKLAWEDARRRLDETRAGMHGVPGAYDVEAITSEGVAVFKTKWEEAQRAVEDLQIAHQGRMEGLMGQYEGAVANTTDPALKKWQEYYTDLEQAQRITDDARAKTMLESWSSALPDMEEILAEMVREHEISIGEIPLEHRQAVADVLLEWAGVTTGLEEEASKWLDIIGETTSGVKTGFEEARDDGVLSLRDTIVEQMPRMKDQIKTGMEEPVDEAIKSVKEYARELKDLDDTHVYVYIHEVTIEEGDDFEP